MSKALAVFTGIFLWLSGSALAQAPYPNASKPIRIVVPFLPGAAPDILARMVAQGLTETFKSPVIVENKTGANGNIGSEDIVHAAADGYSLLFGIDGSIVVNPYLYKLSFDPMIDLVPVASLASNQLLLTANNALPATTVTEFVELAKRAQPPLIYSSSGIGSQHHLAMEMLMRRAGIPAMTHVPYRGASAAVAAMMAGETQVGFSGSASTPLVQAGKLKGIAVSGSKRSDAFPNLPTIGETFPGYAVDVWFGLLARAGTPEPIIERLNGAVRTLLAHPEFVARMRASGSVDVLNLSRQEFGQMIRADYEKYGRLIKELGLKQESQ
jgi:tripartite-type tricarboxylate transporter receptor subunit TctC